MVYADNITWCLVQTVYYNADFFFVYTERIQEHRTRAARHSQKTNFSILSSLVKNLKLPFTVGFI